MTGALRGDQDGSSAAVIERPDTPLLLDRRKTIAFVFGVWSLYGLFFFFQFYSVFIVIGWHIEMSLAEAFATQMITAYFWAAGTLWAIWVSRRWRIERSNWKRPLAVHALHCLLFVIVVGGAHALLDKSVFGDRAPLRLLRSMIFMADREINTYWAVVFITHSYDYYTRFTRVQLRASQLQTELATSRFDLLKAQIHPHFLFNTLNAISSVLHEDAHAADRMIANLGTFLRASLAQYDRVEVALREELELLDCYLDIQKTRFESALQVKVDVAPDVLHLLVPTLILQPLVENAIKHGARDDGGPVTVHVSARRDDGRLVIEVCDSGNVAPPASDGLGIGLSNTRMRLKHMYGDSQSVDLRDHPGTEFAVVLRIPVRAAEAADRRDATAATSA